MRTCCCPQTPRSLLLDVALQDPIERFAGHLPGKHQANLNLAVAPYQRSVDDAEPLRHEREPGAEVREAVGGVLLQLGDILILRGIRT
jgi:hypothetical protein